MPAAEYVCACGHPLDEHDRPPAPREPWGGCNRIVEVNGATIRCECREAWPMDPDDKTGGTA